MLTEAWVIWPYPKTASFNTKVSIWHKRRLHNFIICLQQYFIFILADHYCVSHYVQSKKKYDTKITSCINKFNEQKDNIWLFIAMSFYNLFQGQCVQILMLSTIIAEHTKVCHWPESKIACVNVHKLSSISEKNKIWLEKLHILSISKKL